MGKGKLSIVGLVGDPCEETNPVFLVEGVDGVGATFVLWVVVVGVADEVADGVVVSVFVDDVVVVGVLVDEGVVVVGIFVEEGVVVVGGFVEEGIVVVRGFDDCGIVVLEGFVAGEVVSSGTLIMAVDVAKTPTSPPTAWTGAASIEFMF